MPVRTILWPTDLSPGSLKAAGDVVSLVQQLQAKVVVLYVAVDLCSYFPAYGNYPSQDLLREFQGWEMETAKKRLEGLCGNELKACPNLSIRLVQGDAVEEILKTAESEKADLVVMTSRGHGHGRAVALPAGLGTVARAVLERSKIPVQIIYPKG